MHDATSSVSLLLNFDRNDNANKIFRALTLRFRDVVPDTLIFNSSTFQTSALVEYEKKSLLANNKRNRMSA